MCCLISLFFFLCTVTSVYSHGRMLEPPSRNVLWRLSDQFPSVYDDNQLYCGGFGVQHVENHGKCGICGDAYNAKEKHFENGGSACKSFIARTYLPGSQVIVLLRIQANHGGVFTFHLCPRDKHTQAGKPHYELSMNDYADTLTLSVQLPANLTCNACVFRWQWIAGNNWGKCNNFIYARGCGAQETWRNCADIRISHSLGIRGPLWKR